MNRNVHAQVADQRGVDIREPSTANLFINSLDRDGYPDSPTNSISIAKNESIMNGFFTRLAVQEVTLTWSGNNIDDELDNDFLQFRVQTTGATLYTAQLVRGHYTVAELLDALVLAMNAAIAGVPALAGFVFSVANLTPNYGIVLNSAGPTPRNYTIPAVPTQSSLNNDFLHLNDPDINQSSRIPLAPDLRPFYYLDFVSTQLTYLQDVKDGSTSTENRDVIYRWNFAWDNWNSLDAYGFPIYQGYLPFTQRRNIAFPKQIKWSPNQPIGNLQIDVYTNLGELIPALYMDLTEYQFTLLASEV